jgi:hypothetical protein
MGVKRKSTMITKFKQANKKSTLICLVDNRHLYTSGWATEVSINISDFLIHRFAERDYDIFIGPDEDELLMAATGYSHAVVIAMGTSLGLSDRLFPAIDKLCEEDFFISGHVLHRNENSYYKNSYYELHHQFYIVNINQYIELQCPIIGQAVEEVHTQIEPLRSQGCLYNDHEVAEWVKPGSVEKTYERKLHGWNVISVALANDKKLIDLGTGIRDNKKYLYYEHDHVFLREVSNVYWNHFFCNNFYASWNSDQLKEDFVFDGPVEQYVTVGIGVYWISNLLKLGITDDTRVVFTDINYNCLKFMETMVNEWDGVDYHEFYRKHLPRLPNNTTQSIEPYLEYTRQQWEEFVSKFDNWPEAWARIKSLKFEYVLIDYMSSYNLDWVKPGMKTLINLSDVFTHSPYIATQSLKYRISCENKLLNNVNKVDPDIRILMTSRAADGFHPVKPRVAYGAVKDFDLTDINDLIKPVWHTNDWTSPRMLG